jgi:hypothetical protein
MVYKEKEPQLSGLCASGKDLFDWKIPTAWA